MDYGWAFLIIVVFFIFLTKPTKNDVGKGLLCDENGNPATYEQATHFKIENSDKLYPIAKTGGGTGWF